MSKEGSKEMVDVVSLELSLDKSLAKGPRTLRCCHLDGLNQTDQYERERERDHYLLDCLSVSSIIIICDRHTQL